MSIFRKKTKTADIKNENIKDWAQALKGMDKSLEECAKHCKSIRTKLKQWDAAKDKNKDKIKAEILAAYKAGNEIYETVYSKLPGCLRTNENQTVEATLDEYVPDVVPEEK